MAIYIRGYRERRWVDSFRKTRSGRYLYRLVIVLCFLCVFRSFMDLRRYMI